MQNELTSKEWFESIKAILRDRQIWLQGELDPLNKTLYSQSEIGDIESEILTIDELFSMWEYNPF